MPSALPQQYFTLDLLLHVLSRTFFHPFVAALLPVCLRAVAKPYSSTSFIFTCVFAVAVSLYQVLDFANRRIAYGKPRKVRWEDEVVVITGGAGGLGNCLTEILGMKGVAIAVLDVHSQKREKSDNEDVVKYYQCDVGDFDQVEGVWKEILRDLGTPTILINNAAVVNAGSLLSQTRQIAEETFRVNVLSHYHLNRLFVHGLLNRKKGGCIVTVSSVLAHLGARHLSAYTASKAALLAYHTSLTAELALVAPRVKTILVAPGQLDTQLFADVKLRGWLRNFFGPVVGAGEVAVKIVDMLNKGEGGVVSEPAYARWIAWLGILPAGLQKIVRGWSGVDMQFSGQEKSPVSAVEDKCSDSSDESSIDEG
ncbi:hypothetical protein ACLMJK_007506 [Lecanora helva]